MQTFASKNWIDVGLKINCDRESLVGGGREEIKNQTKEWRVECVVGNSTRLRLLFSHTHMVFQPILCVNVNWRFAWWHHFCLFQNTYVCAFRDRFILMSPTPTIVLLFSFSTTNGRIFQPIYFYRGWWICGPNNNKHK